MSEENFKAGQRSERFEMRSQASMFEVVSCFLKTDFALDLFHSSYFEFSVTRDETKAAEGIRKPGIFRSY